MRTVQLEEVAEFINGRAFKPSEWGRSGIPIIRIQNLTGTNEVFNYFDGPIDERVRVQKGDILISWSASLGVYRWKGENAVLNQHIFKVRLHDGIDPDYFYYAATDAVQEMASRVHGSTMQHITKDRFDSIHIPLPDFSEQQRIAAVLKEADRLRRTRRYSLELSDTFLPAAFLELFGNPVTNDKSWNVALLEDACADDNGIKAGPFGSSLKKEFYSSSGIRVYGQEQVIAGDFSIGDYYISKSMFEDFAAYEVKPRDVLISLVGTFGKVVVVPGEIEKGIINPRLLKISPKSEVLDSTFLAKLIEHPIIQRELTRMSHGGTMGILNAGLLRELRVILPPLHKQQHFAALVARHERLQAGQREALRQADHLFQSLLLRAFAEAV